VSRVLDRSGAAPPRDETKNDCVRAVERVAPGDRGLPLASALRACG
jgi:hypothetical protein